MTQLVRVTVTGDVGLQQSPWGDSCLAGELVRQGSSRQSSSSGGRLSSHCKWQDALKLIQYGKAAWPEECLLNCADYRTNTKDTEIYLCAHYSYRSTNCVIHLKISFIKRHVLRRIFYSLAINTILSLLFPDLYSMASPFIHSFGKCSLIVSLPGPVLEVGDREGNQTQALYSRSSQLNARTGTCYRSCEDPEGSPEPALGTREGFTEEKSSGDLFGTG